MKGKKRRGFLEAEEELIGVTGASKMLPFLGMSLSEKD